MNDLAGARRAVEEQVREFSGIDESLSMRREKKGDQGRRKNKEKVHQSITAGHLPRLVAHTHTVMIDTISS